MTTATDITAHTVLGPIVADGDLTFTADAALTKFGLVYVSALGKVTLTAGSTGATGTAIGIVDRAYADEAKDVSVLLLSRGRVLAMVAASAITVGTPVMAVAAGKVDDYAFTADASNAEDPDKIGVALTAASTDGDVIQVLCL